MGNDVFRLLGFEQPLLNIQKGRVDYLLNVTDNRTLRARASKAAPFMARKFITPFIAQQESLNWLMPKAPKMIFMDSYAELTDQLFVHRKKRWCFCCNYSDIRHDDRFKEQFEAVGLLSLDQLLLSYRKFFTFVRNIYGNVPIVFMHFPTKLDQREKFHKRHEAILGAIKQLVSEFQPFHSLTADPSTVKCPEECPSELEDFPYHFHECVFKEFATQIIELNLSV